MCSRALLLLLATAVALSSSTCDLTAQPASWARVITNHVFFNAWEPDNIIGSNSFCVDNDFMAYSLNYSAHVNLANQSATVQHDIADNSNFDASKVNCGQTISNVQWCQSHCADKQLEAIIVSSAVINGSLPLAIAEQVYSALGSPNDTAIASLQVDLYDKTVHIEYDYYDDVNFCSVYLKIKNPGSFPFASFLTVQKIIMA